MSPEKIIRSVEGGAEAGVESVASPEAIVRSVEDDAAKIDALKRLAESKMIAEEQTKAEGGRTFEGFNPLDVKVEAQEFKEFSEEEINALFASVGEEKPAEKAAAGSFEKARDAAARLMEEVNRAVQEKSPLVREKIEAAGNWYKKQPLKYKIATSVALIGGASASAVVGGAVGTAIATAAFTGTLTQRALGGIATFLTAEGVLKKAAEKEGRERTKWEARRHTFEAAVLGLLTGSGAATEAIKNVGAGLGDTYQSWFGEKPATSGKAAAWEQVKSPTVAAEAPAPIPAPELLELGTIHKGEGIEHALIRQLKAHAAELGFSGDPADTQAVSKWAGAEAHKLAIKGELVDAATGKEIRIATEGIDRVAYVLENDPAGGMKIAEYFKDESGNFVSANGVAEYIYEPGVAVSGETATHGEVPSAPETAPSDLVPESGPIKDVFTELTEKYNLASVENTPENLQRLMFLEGLENNNLHGFPQELINEFGLRADGVKLVRLEEIYGPEKVSGWFTSGDNKYWQGWKAIKDLSAGSVLNAPDSGSPAFGAPLFGDGTELGDRRELQEYLRKLASVVKPADGESVEQFIKRAEMIGEVRKQIGGTEQFVA